MFDDGRVLNGPHPSSAAAALLEACTGAMTALRHGHAQLVAAVAELDRAEAYPECGQPSTTRLLEELLRLDRAHARTLLGQARLLIAPEPDPLHSDAAAPTPDLPATAAAVAEGAVGPEHVDVIDRTMRRLRRLEVPLPAEVLAPARHPGSRTLPPSAG